MPEGQIVVENGTKYFLVDNGLYYEKHQLIETDSLDHFWNEIRKEEIKNGLTLVMHRIRCGNCGKEFIELYWYYDPWYREARFCPYCKEFMTVNTLIKSITINVRRETMKRLHGALVVTGVN